MACACTLVLGGFHRQRFIVARCNMDRGSENAITAHQRAVNMRPQSFGMVPGKAGQLGFRKAKSQP